jgi:1-acyl-sn-glycerol-3-phosphate acyltransferase
MDGMWHGFFECVAGVIAAWVIWAAVAHLLLRHPMGGAGNVAAGFAFSFNRVYTRVWHGLRVEGRENIPRARGRDEEGKPVAAEPLVVVANHTAGVDPQLIQDACPFFIRWMMTSEMRMRAADILWDWLEIIFVSGGGSDAGGNRSEGKSDLAALKETMRYIKAGGVVGIFPEGRLERPARVLHPFQPGVGLLIARTGAKVLPAVISGTPESDTAWGSLGRPSRSLLRFMPVIDYKGTKAAEIVTDLQKRYEQWTGWPVVEPRPRGEVAVSRPSSS